MIAARVPPSMRGDGFEYLYTLVALSRHLSPDLRADDVRAANALLTSFGIDPPSSASGFFPSRSGRLYSWHFWFYPLACTPVFWLLRAMRCNPLAAFQVTNVLFVGVGVYVAARVRPSWPSANQVAFAGLATVSPVLLYLSWPGPEVLAWAAVFSALLLLAAGRPAAAAVAAGIGALQNPPLLVLCLWALGAAVGRRNRWEVAATALGGSLGLLPSAFFLAHFGHGNLIVANGAADWRVVSPARVASMFGDLNQGMLPWVPVALLLAVVATVRGLWTEPLATAGPVACLAAISVLAASTINWNSGSAGLMRYAVWMIPLVTFLPARLLPATRALRIAVAVGIVLQAFVLLRLGPRADYLRQGSLAAWALRRFPSLYNPIPEIFVERQLIADYLDCERFLPIAFAQRNGRVTKLLVDADSLSRVPRLFRTDVHWARRTVARYRTRPGLFYVEPPAGAVRKHPPPTEADAQGIVLRLSGTGQSSSPPEVPLVLQVSNETRRPILADPFARPRIAYSRFPVDERDAVDGRLADLPSLAAGETMTLAVRLPFSRSARAHDYRLYPIIEGIGTGRSGVQVRVDADGAWMAAEGPTAPAARSEGVCALRPR